MDKNVLDAHIVISIIEISLLGLHRSTSQIDYLFVLHQYWKQDNEPKKSRRAHRSIHHVQWVSIAQHLQ